jgi:hypothetical protein
MSHGHSRNFDLRARDRVPGAAQTPWAGWDRRFGLALAVAALLAPLTGCGRTSTATPADPQEVAALRAALADEDAKPAGKAAKPDDEN